ncbi:MAG TPA: hypothetical protein VF029_03730 [Actinomycetota bacterium]
MQLLEEAAADLRRSRYGNREPHCWSPYTTPELLQIMYDAMIADAPPS